MTRNQYFEKIHSELTAIYPDGEARAITSILFEEFFGLFRIDLALASNHEMPGDTITIESAVAELLKDKPLQYVINKAWFGEMTFYVDENVLIPRPETEELVRLVVDDNHKKSPAIIDIGTGSGCIAISLAKAIPGANVSAIDICEEALKIARRNAKENEVDVNFKKCDILSEKISAKYDIIVSNPPYVLESEQIQMRNNVLDYEPHIALFVTDNDPLIFYRAIAELATTALNPEGKLFFEINESKGNEMKIMLEEMGFKDVSVRKDIFDRERMISAQWR